MPPRLCQPCERKQEYKLGLASEQVPVSLRERHLLVRFAHVGSECGCAHIHVRFLAH